MKQAVMKSVYYLEIITARLSGEPEYVVECCTEVEVI